MAFKFSLHITLSLPEGVRKIWNQAQKSVIEIFIGEKERWTNKGTDKQYYIIQLTTIKLCTKFQNRNQVVAEKSLTINVHII